MDILKGIGIWIGAIVGWIVAGYLFLIAVHSLSPEILLGLLIVFFVCLVLFQVDDWN